MSEAVFRELEKVENIKEVIKNLFDVELDISGGWGYNDESAVIINTLDMPMGQFMNLFATLRTNLEMNFDKDPDERYGGINLSLQEEKNMENNGHRYDVAIFEISAMNEKKYAGFIKEYKENYGKKTFDLNDHFSRRKEAVLTRVVECWFLQDREDAK